MTIQAATFILDRVFKDPRLLHRYVADPYRVLSEFDLSPQEIEAIAGGNRERMIAVGIDERVAGWAIRSGSHGATRVD